MRIQPAFGQMNLLWILLIFVQLQINSMTKRQSNSMTQWDDNDYLTLFIKKKLANSAIKALDGITARKFLSEYVIVLKLTELSSSGNVLNVHMIPFVFTELGGCHESGKKSHIKDWQRFCTPSKNNPVLNISLDHQIKAWNIETSIDIETLSNVNEFFIQLTYYWISWHKQLKQQLPRNRFHTLLPQSCCSATTRMIKGDPNRLKSLKENEIAHKSYYEGTFY